MSSEEIPFDPILGIILEQFKLYDKLKLLGYTLFFSGLLLNLITFVAIDTGKNLLQIMTTSDLISKKFWTVQNSLLFYRAESLWAFVGGLSWWITIVSIPILYWFVIKARSKKRELRLVESKIIRKSYLTTFEIVKPEGDTSIEKILNHLVLVFPQICELKKKKLKILRSIEKKKKSFGRKMLGLRDYDLILKTTTGLFVIRIIENKLTLSDLENIIKALNRSQTSLKILADLKIDRTILVLKNMEIPFDVDELEEKIKKLNRTFSLDMIQEDSKLGYSTIWID